MASAPAPLSNYHCRRRDGVVSAYAHTYARVDTHTGTRRDTHAHFGRSLRRRRLPLSGLSCTVATPHGAPRVPTHTRTQTRALAHTHSHIVARGVSSSSSSSSSSSPPSPSPPHRVVLPPALVQPSVGALVGLQVVHAEVRCGSLVSVISVRGRVFFSSYHLREGHPSLFTIIDDNDNDNIANSKYYYIYIYIFFRFVPVAQPAPRRISYYLLLCLKNIHPARHRSHPRRPDADPMGKATLGGPTNRLDSRRLYMRAHAPAAKLPPRVA